MSDTVEKAFDQDFGSLEYWVPDADLWQAYIQNHKEERKEEWKKIAPILKQLFKNESYQGKSYLKQHKKLFFLGDMSCETLENMNRYIRSGGPEFVHSYLYFYFWYHPNLTEGIILERLSFFQEAYEFNMKIGRFSKGYEKEEHIPRNAYMLSRLYESLIEWPTKFKGFTDYGMMGEYKSELILKALLFGKGESLKEGYLSSYCCNSYMMVSIIQKSSICIYKGQVEGVYKKNPRGAGYSLWPQLSEAVEMCKSDGAISEIDINALSKLISKLLNYSERTPGSSELITRQVELIKAQYEEGLFSDWLNQIFEKQIEEMG